MAALLAWGTGITACSGAIDDCAANEGCTTDERAGTGESRASAELPQSKNAGNSHRCKAAACESGPTELVLGGDTSCALFDDGRLKCWGEHPGLGEAASRGDDANEMGHELPFVEVNGGVGKFSSVSVGVNRVCAVEHGDLWCWGANEFGELGIESKGPARVSAPTRIDVGARVKSVASGGLFSCAVLETDEVTCWGAYARGNGAWAPFGYPAIRTVGDEPGEMPEQLTRFALPEPPVALRAGYNHVCAIVESGALHCWGGGNGSELGVPEGVNMGYPLPVSLGEGERFTSVAAGSSHSCALSNEG